VVDQWSAMTRWRKLTQESFFRIVCGAVAGVDHDL